MDRPCWHNDQLGVNKIGKNIKKSPLHQPNFSIGIDPLMPQPQPQGFNISRNDFRSILVQQLTGSPSSESLPQPLPLPRSILKTQQNSRLQKIRPVGQIQINRPRVPPPVMAQPNHELVARPPMHPLPHGSQSIMGHGDQFGSSTAESSVSVYMCYRLSSLGDSGSNGNKCSQLMSINSSHRCKVKLNRTHYYNCIIIIRYGSMVLRETHPFCQLLSSTVRHNRCIIVVFLLLDSTVVGYYPLLRPNILYNLQLRTKICSPLGHLIRCYLQEFNILHH